MRTADTSAIAWIAQAATARRPVATSSCSIDLDGVKVGAPGEIIVDALLRTHNPRIRAAGDVTGGPNSSMSPRTKAGSRQTTPSSTPVAAGTTRTMAEALKPRLFGQLIAPVQPDQRETFGEGLHVLHNPWTRTEVPLGTLRGFTDHRLLDDGRLLTTATRLRPSTKRRPPVDVGSVSRQLIATSRPIPVTWAGSILISPPPRSSR